jgi:translation initiation factor IF-3
LDRGAIPLTSTCKINFKYINYFINEKIRADKVRLIDENGKQIGLVEIQKALQMARERNLDLVQITEKVEPPVCKLENFGKFLYREEKKRKKSNPKKSAGEIKGVRISYTISEHDLKMKASQSAEMLNEGHKLFIEMRLFGRQKGMLDFAKEKMKKFIQMISEIKNCKIERDLKKEGKGLTIIISPEKNIQNK